MESKSGFWKNFFSLGEVGRYFFRSKAEGKTSNFNLRMMHGINKFSILVFLIAVFYLVIKRLF